MTYDICGHCLHAKSSHTENGHNLLYCSSCLKLCDKADYDIIHNPSKIILQDGRAYPLGVTKQ